MTSTKPDILLANLSNRLNTNKTREFQWPTFPLIPASTGMLPKYSTIEFLSFSFIQIYPGVLKEMDMPFSGMVSTNEVLKRGHC